MQNAYLMAVIAMVFWGIAPVFGKIGLGGMQPLVALTLRSLIVSVILIIAVTVSGQWGSFSSMTIRNGVFIAMEGICAALLGQLAYYYALKLGEVGKVSPMVAAFPLVAMVLGGMFLGEKITISKVIAAILITSGVVLLKF